MITVITSVPPTHSTIFVGCVVTVKSEAITTLITFETGSLHPLAMSVTITLK